MKQLARPIPLIATRRRRRIDPAQAIESFSPADPPDGGQAHSGEHCDPAFGHSRSSQRHHQAALTAADRAAAMGSRASIGHRLIAFAATNPLSGPPHAQASGLRRLLQRPARFQDSFQQQLSTCRAASRILVHVHSGPSCHSVRFESFQNDESRPDGQLTSRNNVLAHHT
jgi:hypothetical protein